MNIFLAGTMPKEAKRKMNLYLTESGGLLEIYTPEKLFEGANILQSFYYADDFTSKVIIPNCKRFMLDSGAYSFMAGKQIKDFSEYAEQYCRFVVENNVELFFELDLDRIIGVEETKKLRQSIIKKTGKMPISVWHRERGKEGFIEMCKEYPYVAISGREYQGKSKKYTEMFPWFIDTAHRYGAKIHGLGYTSLTGLTKYHFDSVDSTTWLTGHSFGHIFKFDGKTILRVNKPPNTRVKNSKTVINNFIEWKKFCKYAETKL